MIADYNIDDADDFVVGDEDNDNTYFIIIQEEDAETC